MCLPLFWSAQYAIMERTSDANVFNFLFKVVSFEAAAILRPSHMWLFRHEDWLHCITIVTFQLEYNLEEEGEITVSQTGRNVVGGEHTVS